MVLLFRRSNGRARVMRGTISLALKGVLTLVVGLEALLFVSGFFFAVFLSLGLGLDNRTFLASSHVIAAGLLFSLSCATGAGVAALWVEDFPARWLFVVAAIGAVLTYDIYWLFVG